MGRPRADANVEPTVERVLIAAEAAFARAGYADVRLADVAREAGIRRPSLLYHFGTKELLYARVVERAFLRLGEALTASMGETGTMEARIDALVRAYVAFLEENPQFAPLILREMLDGRGPGRELIRAGVVPLLSAVERFVEASRLELPPGVSVRASLLAVAISATVRAAAGPLRIPLWGRDEPLPAMAHRLLLDTPPAPAAEA